MTTVRADIDETTAMVIDIMDDIFPRTSMHDPAFWDQALTAELAEYHADKPAHIIAAAKALTIAVATEIAKDDFAAGAASSNE